MAESIKRTGHSGDVDAPHVELPLGLQVIERRAAEASEQLREVTGETGANEVVRAKLAFMLSLGPADALTERFFRAAERAWATPGYSLMKLLKVAEPAWRIDGMDLGESLLVALGAHAEARRSARARVRRAVRDASPLAREQVLKSLFKRATP